MSRGRVLVTGNLGYIGTVLTPLLRVRGWEVVGLDTGFFPDDSFYPTESRPDQQLALDVRDVEADDLPDVDAVIHLAALSNDPMGAIDPDLTDQINHRATVRLAEVVRAKGTRRFLFSSSCSIYGAGGDAWLTEDATFTPQTAYAHSKVDAEAGLKQLVRDDFSPTYLRNGTAFGVSPAMRFDLMVANLTGWGWTEGAIKILSDGTPWRPLVHIRDIAGSFVFLLEAERELVHDQPFNVGRDDNNHQVRDVAHAVQRMMPHTDVVLAGKGEPDRRDYRVSFAKLLGMPGGHRIGWSVEAGIAELVGTLRARGLSPDEFAGAPAVRLKRLTALLDDGRLDPTLRWKDRS